jgi:hypothetical protein
MKDGSGGPKSESVRENPWILRLAEEHYCCLTCFGKAAASSVWRVPSEELDHLARIGRGLELETAGRHGDASSRSAQIGEGHGRHRHRRGSRLSR